VRLDDGSVLVLGGRVAGAPQTTAWRFRPRLLGRFTGSLTVVPADEESDPALAPLDPEYLVGPAWELRADVTGNINYAVVGGPIGGDLRVDLTATLQGGTAVIFGHTGPGDLHRALLVSGEEASIERRVAGVASTVCRGSVVPEIPGATLITLDVRNGTARVAVGGQVVLSCNVDPVPVGRVGVGPATTTSVVTVASIAVTR
jgi:hypothetical protein